MGLGQLYFQFLLQLVQQPLIVLSVLILHLSYVTVELLDLTVIISPMSAKPMSGWLVRSSVLSKILELFHKYFEFICGTCMYDMCYIFSTSLCLSVYVFPACNLNTATMCLTVSRAPFHNSSLVESYLYGSNVKGLLSSCSSGLHSVANDRIS